MKSLKKVLLFFLAFLILFYAASRFCQWQTDGFAIAKISDMLLESDGRIGGNFPLDQPYRYLCKGGQSYVFVSEDGRYVLKLLRSSKLNHLKLLYTFVPIRRFEEKIKAQEKMLKATLLSYAIAEKHLRKETGLVGVHLYHDRLTSIHFGGAKASGFNDFSEGCISSILPSEKSLNRESFRASQNVYYSTDRGIDQNVLINTPIKIIDKLGILHTLDPTSHPFIIQEKGVLLKERIAECMESRDLDGARLIFKNLFTLIQSRMEKGITDGDPNLTKNFAFCGNRPIQIDGGRFSIGSSPQKIEGLKLDHLKQWVGKNYPELSEDLSQSYEEFLYEAL